MRCANSDYQFNHKCHKRATRGLSSLPALSLQYYKWTQVEKKYGACSFDVDFFYKLKIMSILIFLHATYLEPASTKMTKKLSILYSVYTWKWNKNWTVFSSTFFYRLPTLLVACLSVDFLFIAFLKLIWFLMRKAITNNEVLLLSLFLICKMKKKKTWKLYLTIIFCSSASEGGLKDNLFVDRSSHSPLDRAFMLWELRKGRSARLHRTLAWNLRIGIGQHRKSCWQSINWFPALIPILCENIQWLDQDDPLNEDVRI